VDKFLTEFLVKEIKAGKLQLAPLDYLLLIGMTVSGVMLRVSVADYCSLPVVDYYIVHETGLKVVGYLFDWAIALLLACLVYSLTAHKIKSLLAYGITFVLPVLVSGSAMWGMGDSVYLFFMLLAFGLLLKEKWELSLIVFGVSVFFHANALFLLPLYVLIYLQGKVKWYGFLSPLFGRLLRGALGRTVRFPLFEAERLLLESREQKLLCYNCPNLFELIGPDKFVEEYKTVALIFSVGLVVVLVTILLTKSSAVTTQRIFVTALFFCLFLPYTLPGMNERSFLPACLLSLLYGFVFLNRFYLPVLLTTITYISYSAYFRGESAVPLAGVSFVLLALMVYVLYHLLFGRKYAEG